jgi:ribonuclease BN (tRNA processing enzyme)
LEARILGAHQSDAVDQHFTTILVDTTLAIDAGSISSALTLDEQLRVRDVLLTHQHWDHVKDLAGFGFNLMGAGTTATIYCTDQVRQVVSTMLLNRQYWIDFFTGPDPNQPVFTSTRVEPGVEIAVGTYRVLPIPVNHSVPTVGYQVTDPSGRKLYYTGDNGPDCGQFWSVAEPDVLITECTFSNVQAEEAAQHGHLCPIYLQAALEVFRARRGYIPRVILVHVNPFHQDRIRIEVDEVARRLHASIEIGGESMTVAV